FSNNKLLLFLHQRLRLRHERPVILKCMGPTRALRDRVAFRLRVLLLPSFRGVLRCPRFALLALRLDALRVLSISSLLLVVGVELLLAFLLRAAVPPVDVEIRRTSTRLRPHHIIDTLRPEARRRRVSLRSRRRCGRVDLRRRGHRFFHVAAGHHRHCLGGWVLLGAAAGHNSEAALARSHRGSVGEMLLSCALIAQAWARVPRAQRGSAQAWVRAAPREQRRRNTGLVGCKNQ
ncbi:unnamed protein product, partial [Pelagomonas calceolata]